jgi:hypothetical protein
VLLWTRARRGYRRLKAWRERRRTAVISH